VLPIAAAARYRDCDRDMIQQMLVAIVLDRQRELGGAQNLVDLLGRDAPVSAHTRTVLMDEP
jgi:hypothetical protein